MFRKPGQGGQQPFSTHTLGTGASRREVELILELSNKIFGVESLSPSTHHSSLDEWMKRLSQRGSILAYVSMDRTVTDISSATIVTWTSDGPAVGFVFAFIKTEPAITVPTMHIWLAGVSEQARGGGVFAALMHEVEKWARIQGVKALSVSTHPAKYERMFSILLKQGFKVKEKNASLGKVLLMKRSDTKV
jgi:GNAT superfamily N-acetyltransferase